jgi:hypothetical protein
MLRRASQSSTALIKIFCFCNYKCVSNDTFLKSNDNVLSAFFCDIAGVLNVNIKKRERSVCFIFLLF